MSTLLPEPGRTRFRTPLRVRPDDIDMNQHVHGSRYFDYVLGFTNRALVQRRPSVCSHR